MYIHIIHLYVWETAVYDEFSKDGLEILPHLLVMVHCFTLYNQITDCASLYLVYIFICSALLLLMLS